MNSLSDDILCKTVHFITQLIKLDAKLKTGAFLPRKVFSRWLKHNQVRCLQVTPTGNEMWVFLWLFASQVLLLRVMESSHWSWGFCDVNASSLSVILAGDKGAGTVEEPDVCALGFGSSFVKTLFLLDCLISSRLWSGDCGSLCLTALEASPEKCWLSLTGVHLGCLWVRTLFLNVLPISDDGWS